MPFLGLECHLEMAEMLKQLKEGRTCHFWNGDHRHQATLLYLTISDENIKYRNPEVTKRQRAMRDVSTTEDPGWNRRATLKFLSTHWKDELRGRDAQQADGIS